MRRRSPLPWNYNKPQESALVAEVQFWQSQEKTAGKPSSSQSSACLTYIRVLTNSHFLSTTFHTYMQICENCEEEPAAVECVQCTMLFCVECDMEFHMPRSKRAHERRSIPAHPSAKSSSPPSSSSILQPLSLKTVAETAPLGMRHLLA